jgi:predicted TIM-barrel fold metal-dependent hydrolase
MAGQPKNTGVVALPKRICDAHQHFWLPRQNPYTWLQEEPPRPFRLGDIRKLRRDYMPDDYRTDAGDLPITATVHMEAEWHPDDPVGESKWIDALRQSDVLPTVAVGAGPLHREDIAEILAAQSRYPFMRGIRHKPAAAPDPQADRPIAASMDAPAWRRGYALLEPNGLSFELQVAWWHLDQASRLARDFPRTPIILNHTGLPHDRSPEGLVGWRKGMEQFAAEPNAAVKISGLGRPPGENRTVVRDTISIFGVERCMFASNFPVDSLVAGLREIFIGFAAMVGDLAEAQRDALFYANAARYYRLPSA